MKKTAPTKALTCIPLEAAWSAKVERQQGLHLDNEGGGDEDVFHIFIGPRSDHSLPMSLTH